MDVWERDILAKSEMQLDSDAVNHALDDHIYFSKEGIERGTRFRRRRVRMQLDSQKSICAALSAITATLLGSGAASASGTNTVDSSILLYSETGRVKIAKGVFDYGRQFGEAAEHQACD